MRQEALHSNAESGLQAGKKTHHADVVPIEKDFGQFCLGTSVVTTDSLVTKTQFRNVSRTLTIQSHLRGPYLSWETIAQQKLIIPPLFAHYLLT